VLETVHCGEAKAPKGDVARNDEQTKTKKVNETGVVHRKEGTKMEEERIKTTVGDLRSERCQGKKSWNPTQGL